MVGQPAVRAMAVVIGLAALLAAAPARADECEALAARVSRLTGADVSRPRSASVIFLKRFKYSIDVGCGSAPDVSLFDGEARLPDRSFFYLAGLIAEALFERPAQSLERLIGECQERGLRSRPGQTSIKLGKRFGVSRCNPGEDSFGITFYIDDKQP